MVNCVFDKRNLERHLVNYCYMFVDFSVYYRLYFLEKSRI